jgi:hypothetical protein
MQFKHQEDKDNMLSLNPILLMIFFDIYCYAKEKHMVDLFVTQTVSTPELDKKLNRVSKSHTQKRAIDVRSRNLDKHIINDIVRYANSSWKFKKYRYMSTSGKYRLAYYHDNGNGEHIHIAIHSKFSIE